MISNTPKYWKRKGWVCIEGNDRKMHKYGGDIDSLDFKFSGEKVGSIYTRFTVSILGLGRNTINELTIWNVGESYRKKRRIQVFAGYDVDRMQNPIFDGFIIDAMPTNPPEMWMNFNCMRFFDKSEPIIGVKPMEDETLENIAKHIADIVDLGWNEKSWLAVGVSKETKSSFRFDCLKSQLITLFGKKFGVRVFDRDGIMCVDDKKPWITHAGEAPKTTLSTETGLLNLGNITMVGLSAKRRLDDTAPLLDWIKFESKFIPKVNDDTYLVIRKRHTGHYRGEEWFTELECIRRYAKV